MLLGASAVIIVVLVWLKLTRAVRARQDAVANERNYREILNASNEAIVIHYIWPYRLRQYPFPYALRS